MDPRSIDTFGGSFPAVLASKSVPASGAQISSFTSRKSIRPDYRKATGYGCEAHPGPVEAVAKTVWATVDLVGFAAGGIEAAWDPVGMVARGAGAALAAVGVVAGVAEAVLGAAASFWLGGVKQNSSEAKPLGCEHLVGVRRFELLTSSVSGKRSPPELNARSRVRECAGNNITELPPSGKNYFLKSGDLRPYPPRCSANSTWKVAFVPPMNCTFA